MSRRWLGIALLLSLGVNLGVVAVLLGERLWPREREAPVGAERPADVRLAPPLGTEPPPGAERPVPRPIPPTPETGPEGETMPPMIARRLHGLADRLDLRGERRERFLEIQREFFSRTREHRSRIVEAQERIRQELAAEDPSPEEVQSLVRELGAERTALEEAFARSVLETRELLGPHQERLYLQFLARVRAGGPAGPGVGPGGRPPRRRR